MRLLSHHPTKMINKLAFSNFSYNEVIIWSNISNVSELTTIFIIFKICYSFLTNNGSVRGSFNRFYFHDNIALLVYFSSFCRIYGTTDMQTPSSAIELLVVQYVLNKKSIIISALTTECLKVSFRKNLCIPIMILILKCLESNESSWKFMHGIYFIFRWISGEDSSMLCDVYE